SVWYSCYRDSCTATAAVALMLKVHRQRHTWTDAVDGYVALSEFAKSKFISAGIPAHKISVKPNFVYEDPGEHTGKGEYALFVGRLSPEKGLSTLIAAWASLPIPLVVVGDGPLRSELEVQVRGHALNIDFRGRLERDQSRALMK